ncbi:stem cell self-renewal protein Piwi, partial [Glonium stellatum]
MANIAMKMNLKLGNINHSVIYAKAPFVNKQNQFDTIVLGADVTHTGANATPATPSLAAVVGSVESTFGKFLGSMRTQEANTEIIDNLRDMVIERLRAWREANGGRLPSKILYYRDGVSEGQYLAVREKEITQIKTAYYQMQAAQISKQEPQITAIVVTKRHHTRFYPSPECEMTKKGNCIPGTVVDSGITNPVYFDFFLQSHDALEGTAKPTYYFVLENGMRFTAQQLQDFTHALCHTYVRATKSVSYAPPAYYADRLCERGRCYI